MKIFLLGILVFGQIALGQQRILVSPRSEFIPLGKEEGAVSSIIKSIQSSLKHHSSTCSDKLKSGYSADQYPPVGRFGIFYKDVLGQWSVAPASGLIDTIFWLCNGENHSKESLVVLRMFNSNIGPDFGPGIRPGPYNPPCQNWGYWVNTQDADQGIAAFREDAYPDTIWHSTYNGPVPSIPPFGDELWG